MLSKNHIYLKGLMMKSHFLFENLYRVYRKNKKKQKCKTLNHSTTGPRVIIYDTPRYRFPSRRGFAKDSFDRKYYISYPYRLSAQYVHYYTIYS